jgi:hypothetical protein
MFLIGIGLVRGGDVVWVFVVGVLPWLDYFLRVVDEAANENDKGHED